MEAGFGKVEITPTGTAPLAGYFTFKKRESRALRDPLFARAVAFREGELSFVLILLDLLLVSEEMHQGIKLRLADTGAKVLVAATHTHSGPGGFWNSFAPKLALGPFRPGMLDFLCNGSEKAARAALSDLAPAKWVVHTGKIPKLARNRRDTRGPLDDGLWALRLSRSAQGNSNGIVVGFPGHPVIVAERDFHKISADFPGDVVRRIEKRAPFAAFVNGALGAVDVFFPDEDITAEENLDMQAAPIVAEALKVQKKALKSKANLRFATREIELRDEPDVEMTFDDQPRVRKITRPISRIASLAFGRTRITRWRLQGFALGDACFIGTPADLGVSVSLAIQEYARKRGFKTPFVASQADGYIGYLHRREDYKKRPSRATIGMAIYENMMGIFGHDMGEKLLVEAKALVDELADK